MPRQAVSFANHGKSNQKRSEMRRQNRSVQASAQPQLSRSKRPQTHQRSNSEDFLPRYGATARHTPEAHSTPRGESADAGSTQVGTKSKHRFYG